MTYKLNQPGCTFAGAGSLSHVADILSAESAKSVLIFADRAMISIGLIRLLTDELDKLPEVHYSIYSNMATEPSYQDVEHVVSEAGNEGCDLIIGIGGGSVMDAAKLFSVLKGAPYTICDLLRDPKLARKLRKTLMIPTTCGTGAEATCNAIVAIPEADDKKGIVNTCMIPDYVILDSRLVEKLPKSIVASTGVDALAHVVECYTSLKATPLSNTYAEAGAKLIFHNLREAYLEPENLAAREALMLGAYYGGIAITGSGTTAVHALSYPLGGKYHIAHGTSNAILFAHVMAFNKPACEAQLATLCDAVYPELVAQSAADRAQKIIDEIEDIVRVTNIPTDLSQYHITGDDLDFLVKAGSEQTRLLVNNRRALSLDDIRGIYQKVIG